MFKNLVFVAINEFASLNFTVYYMYYQFTDRIKIWLPRIDRVSLDTSLINMDLQMFAYLSWVNWDNFRKVEAILSINKNSNGMRYILS